MMINETKSLLSGRGNGMKMNTFQYHVTYCHLASHMRQDDNTLHDNLMQNLHMLTSKANN